MRSCWKPLTRGKRPRPPGQEAAATPLRPLYLAVTAAEGRRRKSPAPTPSPPYSPRDTAPRRWRSPNQTPQNGPTKSGVASVPLSAAKNGGFFKPVGNVDATQKRLEPCDRTRRHPRPHPQKRSSSLRWAATKSAQPHHHSPSANYTVRARSATGTAAVRAATTR